MDVIIRSLRRVANELGFSDCRVARAMVAEGAEAYLRWIGGGFHAGMDWLARFPERRCDPRLVLDGCRSVVMLTFDYGVAQGGSYAPVAGYAQGADYHGILESKLADLDCFLQQYGGEQRCYVDSGPVLERDFAVACGVGWRGRNGLVVRESGSRFFLATILTTLDLPADQPVPVRCGSCRRCLDSCPTGAICGGADGEMDASRCISYLTIENKGEIPLELRSLVGGRIYGCDSCQDCCPWNRRETSCREVSFKPSAELKSRTMADLLMLDEDGFLKLFRNSPIRRIKLAGLQRNVCVAMGNVGGECDLPALEKFLEQGGVFASHAEWAIVRIRERIKEA